MKFLRDMSTFADAYVVSCSLAPFQYNATAVEGTNVKPGVNNFNAAGKTNQLNIIKYINTGVII